MFRIAIAICACLFTACAFAGQYSNVIVFGDSLSDIGNNQWVQVEGRGAEFAKGAPISNIDVTSGKPTLWIQYLVQKKIFLESTIIPSREFKNQDLSKTNVDYAWASAETGDRYLNDLSNPFAYVKGCKQAGIQSATMSCVPGVMLQVQMYIDNLKATKQTPGKNTVFIIWAGGNDIFDNISRAIYRTSNIKSNPELLAPQDAESFAWFPSYNLLRAVNLLTKAGVPANHIYIFNLPNIAQTPAAISMVNKNFGDNPKEANLILSVIKGITEWYNYDLQSWINYGIKGNAKPHLVTINTAFAQIEKNKSFEGYTFSNVTDSCVANHVSPACTGYVFFNEKHPTVMTGKALANYIQTTIEGNSK